MASSNPFANLQEESDALREAWMRHEETFLGDYLVSEVEDPRIHFPSLLTRGMLVETLFPGKQRDLIWQEYRFGLCMSFLQKVARQRPGIQTATHLRHALEQGLKEFKSMTIASYLQEAWDELQQAAEGEHYLKQVLDAWQQTAWDGKQVQEVLETFMRRWASTLPEEVTKPCVVLEPACGSANDYRSLAACGLATKVQYRGFDLCPKNIENANRDYPHAAFEVGNIFDIPASDKSVDFLYVHDLFEHLSAKGMQRGFEEVARVTRGMAVLSFFNAAYCPSHTIRPRDGYHWNRLSLGCLQETMKDLCCEVEVIHTASFLKNAFGCHDYHNPGSATLVLHF